MLERAEIVKACMDLSCLVSGGREFQTLAPLKLKAFLPKFVEVFGRWSMPLELALVLWQWTVEEGVRRGARYPGSKPFRLLKVWIATCS